MNLADALDAAEQETGYRPRPSGSGYLGKCPCHDDHTPSLGLLEGNDGEARVKCHAGCDWK